MPKSANSIDCPCGGHYVKKNQSKHFKTKKHQKYEEEQLEKCANCKEELTEDTHIFTLSKGEEEKTWCDTCFDDCGRDAREDGWTFDEQGEELLNAEDEEDDGQCERCGKNWCENDDFYKNHYLWESTTEQGLFVCRDCIAKEDDDKDCEHCSDKCIHCKNKSTFDKDTTECSECGMYQDIDVVDE